jgi:hypothetical protein
MDASPLEVFGKQIKYGFIMLVGLLVGAQFINNNKFDRINAHFDRINAHFDRIENALDYIKASVDEHTIYYDSSRIPHMIKFADKLHCNVRMP